MKRLLIPAAAVVAGCCLFGVTDYPETVDEGFVPLFNGTDLSGWAGATEVFGVDPKEPGVLQCFPDRTLPKGKRRDLWTEKTYGNFVLRFEFMMPTNGDCGLGIRYDVKDGAGCDGAYHGMCELQLLDDGGSDYYDAAAKKDRLKPYQYAGSVFGVVPSRRDNSEDRQAWGKYADFAGGGSYVRKPGMWNFEEVKVVGGEIEVCLNGHLVTKADLSKFTGDGDTPDGRKHPGIRKAKGRIAWLGDRFNVKFKNIRIRELPDGATMAAADLPPVRRGLFEFETCFNGCPDQLAENWKGVTTEDRFNNPSVRQKASSEQRRVMQGLADIQMRRHWSVRGGSLCFDGLKGGCSLATRRDYADFELWADWRLLSATGDSGLCLRGSPQVQIWDAHNQGNSGSGGLCNNRKNPSRALAIADRQIGDWNRFHVIMRGEKVTVWLNGVLVTDDVTLENSWDRSQPIFPSGQIELQCHGDPVEWRNVFIREL